MSQGVLPYSFESAGSRRRATAHAGLCPYLELACVAGLLKSIRDNVPVCTGEQGYTAEQIVMALISLNLAGGQCVDDLQILEEDDGFGKVFQMAERYHLSRQERRRFDKRFRRGRQRNTPSPSVVFRFLAEFHDAEQEKLRKDATAFIPKANEALLGLMKVNADLVAFMQSRHPEKVATLEMDATIVQTYKRDALYCYKGIKSYQPHNVYWSEQEMLLYSEFRDGNVPAGFEQLRVLQEAFEHLPAGVDKAMLRSDTAAYQHDLLRYCASGTNKRFGVIEFAVGSDVTPEFRRAVVQVPEEDWKPLYQDLDGVWIATRREWAEVPLYVPNEICKSKSDPDYRYLATREVLKQQPLPELRDEHKQLALPFKTLTMGSSDRKQEYKIFGAVTNLQWSGDRVLRWLYQRCGKSEEVHSIQKEDLAGGQLPSADFGENAACPPPLIRFAAGEGTRWIMILAFNLNTLMKRLVLGDGWTRRRMKALRFHLIDVAGTLLNHAGQFIMKLNVTADIFRKLQDIRRAIRTLMAPAPT